MIEEIGRAIADHERRELDLYELQRQYERVRGQLQAILEDAMQFASVEEHP
jgi:hypothetical protein